MVFRPGHNKAVAMYGRPDLARNTHFAYFTRILFRRWLVLAGWTALFDAAKYSKKPFKAL